MSGPDSRDSGCESRLSLCEFGRQSAVCGHLEDSLVSAAAPLTDILYGYWHQLMLLPPQEQRQQRLEARNKKAGEGVSEP